MSEKINCPFCGNIIDSEAIRCPNCASLFKEPELPKIKFQNFGVFMALYILLRGWFGIIWLLINTHAINKLTTQTKDNLKFNWLIVFLLSDIGIYLYYFTGKIPLSIAKIVSLSVLYLIFVGLTYRILRIIQKYSEKTYGIIPEINPYYIWFFNIFYLIHFIDTYTNRIWEIHEHFNMKPIHWIMFIIIFAIAPIAIFAVNPPLSVAWDALRSLLKL